MKTYTHKNRTGGYHIVRSAMFEGLQGFEQEVARMLAMGWNPAGGVQVVFSDSDSFPTYHQALWYAYAE